MKKEEVISDKIVRLLVKGSTCHCMLLEVVQVVLWW